MSFNGLVIRIRVPVKPSNHTLMETVACDQCGQRFAIHHDPAHEDAEVARKQASWVKEQLVWDHIQERKLQGKMELP